MKAKKIVKETTNRGEFNRAYKRALEHEAKIHCDRCRYHRGENYTGNGYGGYVLNGYVHRNNGHLNMKYPNWKLVSKNRKQWMKKPMQIKSRTNINGTWFEIKFPA